MKLNELTQSNPVFAWLEPSNGPNNIRGVILKYIEPLVPKHKELITNAEEKDNKSRAEQLRQNLKKYQNKGQKFFTPDFGWWQTEDDFHNSREGFGGITKGRVMTQNPNLIVVSSKKQAVKSAKEAGII